MEKNKPEKITVRITAAHRFFMMHVRILVGRISRRLRG